MPVAQEPSYAELAERCERLEAELRVLRRTVDTGSTDGESEARLRSILNRVENIPIQGYDARRRVIFWNHASTLVYGYTHAEALGRRLEDLIIPPAMREAVVAGVDAWIAGGPAIPAGELVLCNKNGDDVPVYSSHIMHVTRDGDREMFCVDVDLRELKRSEQKHAQLLGEKSRLERQYLQAQKFEAIGRLAGGIAHDFNNLLQAINGYASLAVSDLPPEHPALKPLTQVQRAGERARGLVSQLLTVGRRQQLEPADLDLNLVVAEMLQTLQGVLGERIRLRFRPQAEPGRVTADHRALDQIVLNLCLNARDAMPAGGLLDVATTTAELDEAFCREHSSVRPGRYVVLEVADTGVGIEPALAEQIFEPFYTTKEAGRGTGLGLAIVHSLVCQHRGLVCCESVPQQGAAFRVYLPVN